MRIIRTYEILSTTISKKLEVTGDQAKAALKLRRADPNYEDEVKRYDQPLPSREYLLQILAERGAPMFADEFVEMFAISDEEATLFQRRLGAMVRDGEVVINRKGAICVADKLDLIKGRVLGHADGFGFVVPDGGGSDLFLSEREMHKVLHNDLVMVRQVGLDRRGRPEAKIVEVLEHVNKRLVGRLFVDQGVRFVVAEEKRICQDILVTPDGVAAEPSQVVMIELVTQPSKTTRPIGRIVEVLGNFADAGMEIEIALRKHDLPNEFSEAALALAEKTPQKVMKKDWKTSEGLEREDVREMPLVTIDGDTSRDFDDAVYAEKQGSGWRLVVAIADVSHYVRPKDALDATALERGNSVYFPRRVIPMLPEQLSNGICSLNPDVERNCMVCDMQIDAKGQVKAYRFYPAVMRSHARFTYDEVWAILQAPKGEAAKKRGDALVPHLQTLYGLYKVLLKTRQKRGAMDFDSNETMMLFNDDGKIERIVPVKRNDAHRLIEECMLAANVCSANFLAEHQHPTLYRNHEGPTPVKLENLRKFLGEHALVLEGGEKPTTHDYAVLMDAVKLRPDAGLIQIMLLRSMQQAVYSPDRIGHFGLAYEAYTHFTSPIRRYPDLLVHRAIKAVLSGSEYRPGDWKAIGLQCSMTERRADEATRDVENWLKCYYIRDHVGEVFEGTISAVTNFGLFVSLDDMHVEGLVHISELGADYFHYDQASHSLRGERSGHSYGLTDRLTIKVARVSLETSKVDFVLAEPAAREAAPAEAAKPAKGGKRRAEASESAEPPRSKKAGAGKKSGQA